MTRGRSVGVGSIFPLQHAARFLLEDATLESCTAHQGRRQLSLTHPSPLPAPPKYLHPGTPPQVLALTRHQELLQAPDMGSTPELDEKIKLRAPYVVPLNILQVTVGCDRGGALSATSQDTWMCLGWQCHDQRPVWDRASRQSGSWCGGGQHASAHQPTHTQTPSTRTHTHTITLTGPHAAQPA